MGVNPTDSPLLLTNSSYCAWLRVSSGTGSVERRILSEAFSVVRDRGMTKKAKHRHQGMMRWSFRSEMPALSPNPP